MKMSLPRTHHYSFLIPILAIPRTTSIKIKVVVIIQKGIPARRNIKPGGDSPVINLMIDTDACKSRAVIGGGNVINAVGRAFDMNTPAGIQDSDCTEIIQNGAV